MIQHNIYDLYYNHSKHIIIKLRLEDLKVDFPEPDMQL